MSRYSGPSCKLCRRETVKLFLKGEKCSTKCTLDKRQTPPGAARPRRGKISEFALRLREKQKLRRMAGMNETSFGRRVAEALKSPESTGEALLRGLELRLDNVTRRLGFASSTKGARQLVRHGHVKVAGKVMSIPSYVVQAGDVVSLDPRLKDNTSVKLSLETAQKKSTRPAFLELDEAGLSGKVVRVPDRTEMSFPVNEQLIVEYYSR
ncbi:MAG: 30S ribosomal protein S4 [Elusimicrobia bacterium]|nr:30S ribosomal protein S4 [Elusimicrobiota bacterium]